jgi:recombination protein RecA
VVHGVHVRHGLVRQHGLEAEVSKDKLDMLAAAVCKRVGDGGLRRFGATASQQVEVIPTGSMRLDLALGCGGWPLGRLIELFGHESSGKSTLSLHACAQAQRLGHAVVYIDAEHALDPAYATNLGVKMDDLLLSQPMSGEEGLDIVDEVCKVGTAGLVVVDSVAALAPLAEIEGEMSDVHVGLQARMMAKALRKITALAAKARIAVLFINQLRQKIGGPPSAYNKITPGGEALKFYASVRVDVSRGEPIKDRDQTIGNTHRARVVKNKLAPPFQRAEFDMLHGHGIDRLSDLASAAIEAGAFEVKGSWYSLGGERVCQGKIALTTMVRDDAEFRAKVAAALMVVKPSMRWVEVE